jgi:ankyrin repeat protein
MNPRTRIYLIAPVVAIALLTGAMAPNDRELLDAARRGDVAAVRAYLKEGADPNAALGDGLTALHLAAQQGNVEIAKILIDAGARVGAGTRIGRYTPLHLAAEGAHTAVIQTLLAAKADPAAVATPSGSTPLHLAAKAMNGESAARLLVENGAPVNAQEASYGQTALMIAAAYNRPATVRELMKLGADPGIRTLVVDVLKRMVIDKAASERLAKAIEEIRNSSPDGWDRPLTMEETQAAIAIQREFLNSKEEIEAWIGTSIENINPDVHSRLANYSESGVKYQTRPIQQTQVRFTGGMTALLHAAREGHVEVAEALLDGGADINQVDGTGMSPLGLAATNGQFDLAMMLIKRGADPNIASHTDGITPLFATVQTQWYNFTGYPGPRAQDRQQTGYLELMRALLQAGADPNARITRHLWFWAGSNDRGGLDINGATPFYRAAVARDVDAMKVLAEFGADPNIPSMWDEVGMRGGRQEDGRTGDDSGLPPFPKGTPNMYPIHAAAGAGALGASAIDINAVPNNYLNAVKYLVEVHGADVNQRSSWGHTAMHYAATRGDTLMIEYLLSKGADINPVNRLGQTAVDVARGGAAGFHYRAEQPATVRYMVDRGAEFKCLHVHFRGTGNWCAGSGIPEFEGIAHFDEPPTPPKSPTAPPAQSAPTPR